MINYQIMIKINKYIYTLITTQEKIISWRKKCLFSLRNFLQELITKIFLSQEKLFSCVDITEMLPNHFFNSSVQ